MKNPIIILQLTFACFIATLSIPGVLLAAEKEHRILYLDQSEWNASDFGVQTGCKLLRELVRQSLLVAAELDHGWIPRDHAFGELSPSDYAGPKFKLSFDFRREESFSYQVFRLDQDNKLLATETIPSDFYDVTVYQKTLDLAERQMHLTPPLAPQHELSTRTTTNLQRTSSSTANLDFLTVWLNLRVIHREIQEHGETPERLGALARNYSTFGSLNYNIPCDIPKASLARGLVYAQRLVRTNPQSSDSYYTRAYSWILAGFPVFAMEDLKTARSLNGTPPEWLPVMEAYISSDLDQLQEYLNGDGINAQWAGLLGAFATHNSDFTTRFFQFVKPAAEKNPQNLQLYHLANDCMGGVGSRHWSTTTCFEEFNAMMRTRLPALEEIDKAARNAACMPKKQPASPMQFIEQLLMDSASRNSQPHSPIRYPALYSALMEQADTDFSTPSTALLANTIRETLFTFSFYRLNFMKFWWGVSTSTTVNDLTRKLPKHPYSPILEAFADGADVPAFIKKTALDDPDINLYEMINGKLMNEIKPDFENMSYPNARMVAWNNMDRNAFDLVPYLSLENNKIHPHYIRALLVANPNHYAAVMFALWDKDLPTDSFIEEHAGMINSSAEACWRLGKNYAKQKQWEKARAMYEKSLAITPTREATRALAALCLQQGDRDSWLTYMIASLDFPDNGLETAQTHRDIAVRLLYLGDWENAVPFAEASARCGSDWGLNLAAWCNGLVGRAERSQQYLEQSACRYNQADYLPAYYETFGTQPATETIRALIDSQYKAHSSGNTANRQKAAAIAGFRKDFKAAVTLLEQELERSNDPWNGVWAALICESEGWIEQRDKILEETRTRYAKLRYPSHNRKGLKGFVDLYLKINTSPEMNNEQIQGITSFAKGYSREGFNVDAHAFAGELLRLKGQDELARQLFIDIIKPHEQGRIVEFLPYQSLRKMGEDPVQLLRKKYEKKPEQPE